MKIDALIIDFDNTVISTSSIGEKLFAPLFELLEKNGKSLKSMAGFKEEIMRIPFQKLAAKWQIKDSLYKECIDLLKELTYNEPIETYADYSELKKLDTDKFLVTTGFSKMQQSKIDAAGVRADFKEVYVVDPEKTTDKKIDVFKKICQVNKYDPKKVIVIGDNPESEIKAGKDLGMITVLYNKGEVPHPAHADYTITNYNQLMGFLNKRD